MLCNVKQSQLTVPVSFEVNSNNWLSESIVKDKLFQYIIINQYCVICKLWTWTTTNHGNQVCPVQHFAMNDGTHFRCVCVYKNERDIKDIKVHKDVVPLKRAIIPLLP